MLRPSWGGTSKPYKKTDGDILSVRSQANDSFSNNKFNRYLIQMAALASTNPFLPAGCGHYRLKGRPKRYKRISTASFAQTHLSKMTSA